MTALAVVSFWVFCDFVLPTGIGSTSEIALAANGRGGARLIRVRAGQGATGGRLGGGRLNPPAILQTLLGPAFRLYAHDMGGGTAAVEIPERLLARGGLSRGPAGAFWPEHDYAGGIARQSNSDDLEVPVSITSECSKVLKFDHRVFCGRTIRCFWEQQVWSPACLPW